MKNAMRLVKHEVPFFGKDQATTKKMSLRMHRFNTFFTREIWWDESLPPYLEAW
jgi:hypothetical protein